jgi:hypothetical protein
MIFNKFGILTFNEPGQFVNIIFIIIKIKLILRIQCIIRFLSYFGYIFTYNHFCLFFFAVIDRCLVFSIFFYFLDLNIVFPFTLFSRIMVLFIEIIIILHQSCLGHDFNLHRTIFLLFLVTLQFKGF